MRPSLRQLSAIERVLHPISIASLLKQQPTATSGSSSTVEVQGWVRTLRRQKKVSFISLHDGSDHRGIQAVLPTSSLEQLEQEKSLGSDGLATGLGSGASVQLVGRLVEKQGGKGQGKGKERQTDDEEPGLKEMELQVDSLKVLDGCDGAIYPLQPKDHSLPFLRRNSHLRGRTSLISTMLRARDTLSRSASSYFHSQECLNVSMPVITSSDCEGAGEVFSVTVPTTSGSRADEALETATITHKQFWDHPAYLSVSGQLHLEAVVVGGSMSRAWHLGPAFRAERSDTNRHLNEFWMCEAEICTRAGRSSSEQLDQVMDLAEGLVKQCVVDLAQERGEEIKAHLPEGWKNMASLLERIEQPFKRMDYSAAIENLLHAHSHDPTLFSYPPSYDAGLRSEHERYLASKYGPTFITNYPIAQKPFYMRINDPDQTLSPSTTRHTVACFDLLVSRIGELAGGSLREERLPYLEEAIQRNGMNKKGEYEWYLDTRRYGSVPHGGFGLGWERLVAWLCGLENVREAIPFARGSEGTRF